MPILFAQPQPAKPIFIIAHTDVQYRVYCRDNKLTPNRTAYRLMRIEQIQGWELSKDQIVVLESGHLSFRRYDDYLQLMEFINTRFRIKL